jgi:hypothetical protein
VVGCPVTMGHVELGSRVEVKITTMGVVDEDADVMAGIQDDGGLNVTAVEGKSEGVTV